MEKSDPLCGPLKNDGFLTFLFGSSTDACWSNSLGNYDIEWETGEGTSKIENLTPGEYCIRINADPNGTCPDCYAYYCNEITEASDDLAINGFSNDRCFTTVVKGSPPLQFEYVSYSPGWIIINPSGGSGNLTVNWLDGYVDNDDDGVRVINATGTYCVQISDECQSSVVQCFEISNYFGTSFCVGPPVEDDDPQGPFLVGLPEDVFEAAIDSIYQSDNTLVSTTVLDSFLVYSQETKGDPRWAVTNPNYPTFTGTITLTDQPSDSGEGRILLDNVTSYEYERDRLAVRYLTDNIEVQVNPNEIIGNSSISLWMFNSSGQLIREYTGVMTGETISIQQGLYPSGIYYITSKFHETTKIAILK